jgi:hypothetical protein
MLPAATSMMTPAITPLVQSLAWMEANPLIGEVLIKDVLGFNAPQMAIAAARSKGDFWDTTRAQLANTAMSLGGSFTLPFATRWLASAVSGVPSNTIKKLGAGTLEQSSQTYKAKLAHVAGSFGFLFPFAFIFVATPYFRNWLTLKQTGTANFKEIIGLGTGAGSIPSAHKSGKRDKANNNKATANTMQRTPEEEQRYQLKMMNTILAWGAGLGLALTAGLGMLARQLPKSASNIGSGAKKVINGVYNNFKLNGKQANQLNTDLSIFIFWLMPAYVGYIMAARGKHERREQVIKTVNSVLWFTVFNRFFTNPYYGKKFKKLQERLGQVVKQAPEPKASFVDGKTGLAKLVGTAKYRLALPNWVPSFKEIKAIRKTRPLDYKVFSRLKVHNELMRLGISIVMLASSPQILNVLLTRYKVNQEREDFALNNGLRRLNKGLMPKAKLPKVTLPTALQA